MKTKLLAAVSFSILIAACADTSKTVATTQSAVIENCDTQPPAACVSGNDNNSLQVNLKAAKLIAVPPTICAHAGATIEIELMQPRGTEIMVFAVPKDASDNWLLESNESDPGKIEITVPASTSVGDYDYLLITSDGRCLDPRIHIDPGFDQ